MWLALPHGTYSASTLRSAKASTLRVTSPIKLCRAPQRISTPCMPWTRSTIHGHDSIMWHCLGSSHTCGPTFKHRSTSLRQLLSTSRPSKQAVRSAAATHFHGWAHQPYAHQLWWTADSLHAYGSAVPKRYAMDNSDACLGSSGRVTRC